VLIFVTRAETVLELNYFYSDSEPTIHCNVRLEKVRLLTSPWQCRMSCCNHDRQGQMIDAKK